MNLDTFEGTPPFLLNRHRVLFRIQPARARPGSPAIGALRVARASSLAGRFSIPDRRVAYFADSQDTAGYEVFGRREQQFISLERLRAGELLCAELADDMILLDLTQHAASYPVLQSTRYSPTQALAAEAASAGFDGIAYRSAQQHGGTCYALFEHTFAHVRARWRQRLVQPRTGNLHRLVVTVASGAQLPLA